MITDASTLRSAARRLRRVARAVDDPDGLGKDVHSWADEWEHKFPPSPDYDYIAAMHPAVALATAEVLDDAASCMESGCHVHTIGTLSLLANEVLERIGEEQE